MTRTTASSASDPLTAQDALDALGTLALGKRLWVKLRSDRGTVEALFGDGQGAPLTCARWPEPKPPRVPDARRRWWRGCLLLEFPFDDRLPGLEQAVDPDWIAGEIARVLGTSPGTASCTVIRYKPGRRCVLKWTAGSSSWCAKVHRAGEAEMLFERTRAVQVRAPGAPLVFPIAVNSAASLLIAPWIRGPAWTDLADADRPDALRAAGAALAALHAVPPPGDWPARTPDLEARRLESAAEKIAREAPELAGPARSAAGPAARILRALPADPRTCHGECDPGQFLFVSEGARLVDPDNLRSAHPASDIGGFLAALERFLSDEAERRAAGAAFLSGYRSGGGGGVTAEAQGAFAVAKRVRMALSRVRRRGDGWGDEARRLLMS